MAQATTWKASRQITAWGARWPTTAWIRSVPSALTWVSWPDRVWPSRSKKLSRVMVLRPLPTQTSRPVSWQIHAQQVPLTFAVGDLIDTDAAQPGEVVACPGGLGDYPDHDGRHCPPGGPAAVPTAR